MAESFVQESLSSCRQANIEASLRTKLRGRKLLLERSRTYAAGEGVRETSASNHVKSRGSSGGSSGTRRRERKGLLDRSVREVTYGQLQRQHTAWVEYAQASLSRGALAERLDRHGAPLRVVSSASSVHASAEGLLLAETRRMLALLGPSRLVWVPKERTVVEITLPAGYGTVQLEGLAMGRCAHAQT